MDPAFRNMWNRRYGQRQIKIQYILNEYYVLIANFDSKPLFRGHWNKFKSSSQFNVRRIKANVFLYRFAILLETRVYRRLLTNTCLSDFTDVYVSYVRM